MIFYIVHVRKENWIISTISKVLLKTMTVVQCDACRWREGCVWQDLPFALSRCGGRNSFETRVQQFHSITRPGLPIAQWALTGCFDINIDKLGANQKVKAVGWSAALFPFRWNVNKCQKIVLTLKMDHALPYFGLQAVQRSCYRDRA